MNSPAFAKPIRTARELECRHSVYTLVTDPPEYGGRAKPFTQGEPARTL